LVQVTSWPTFTVKEDGWNAKSIIFTLAPPVVVELVDGVVPGVVFGVVGTVGVVVGVLLLQPASSTSPIKRIAIGMARYFLFISSSPLPLIPLRSSY
jgi:membrane-bound ClpP family serine protease